MDVKRISENIKKFRELKGFTREYVSDELEMSVSGYSKIERGEIDLTITKIDKIAAVLGINPSQVLNFDATNVFNVSHNHQVYGLGHNNHNNYIGESTQKYIKLLEEENARLKKIID